MAYHSCPSTLSPFMHGDTLTLYDCTGYCNDSICDCDICDEPVQGLILNPSANILYSCNGCGFDIHPGCVLERSVQAPPTGYGRPQLRRVQMAPQQWVACVGPPNNNHLNYFTPNLHFKDATHMPQYYVPSSSAVVQPPFNNHGGNLATKGGGSTGHRSFGRKMYDTAETVALGVLSSAIFGGMVGN